MAISVQHTSMPTSSNWYTASGTGSETVTLNGVNKIIIHTKKELIKVQKSKTKNRYTESNTDEFDNQIVDLKKGTDEIVINGWLEDDTSETAWNKFWKLRAMCSRGGPVTNLTIDNVEFDSDTQDAFLEDVTGTANADDFGALNTSKDGMARVEISIQFFIGDER